MTDIRICARCKSELLPKAKFCAACGHEYRGPAEQAFRVVLVIGLALVMLIIGIVLFGLVT